MGEVKGAGLRLLMNRCAEGDATQTQNTGKKQRQEDSTAQQLSRLI